jgi:hypothetical protein
MSLDSSLQYLTDDSGKSVAVVVPTAVWRMKRRLLEAKGRIEGVPLDDARAKLGI